MFGRGAISSVSVVGCGKLGLPLAAVLGQAYPVTAIDVDSSLIGRLQQGEVPFFEKGLAEKLETASVEFTSDFAQAANTDITFVIVPTPSKPDGTFTSEYVVDAVKRFSLFLRHKETPHTVVVVSTVMPGDTDGVVRTVLEAMSRKSVGSMLRLAYSPEFIALGDVINGLERPDFVLIGESSPEAGNDVVEVLSSILMNDASFQRMSIVNAEITKISINAYITMKACFANNLGEICERILGADAGVVAEAVGLDSRINRKYLKPAVAVAGPCLPRDSIAFSMMAKQVGVTADLADAADTINCRQAERITQQVIQMVDATEIVGILGLSYKPGTYVADASPGVELARCLAAEGVSVVGTDVMARPGGVAIIEDAQEMVNVCSVVVLMTPWPEYRSLEFSETHKVLDCWDFFDGIDGERIVAGRGM